MGFSRQEYWSGLPFPSPEDDLPGPGIKPTSLMSPVLAGRFFTSSATWDQVPQLIRGWASKTLWLVKEARQERLDII